MSIKILCFALIVFCPIYGSLFGQRELATFRYDSLGQSVSFVVTEIEKGNSKIDTNLFYDQVFIWNESLKVIPQYFYDLKIRELVLNFEKLRELEVKKWTAQNELEALEISCPELRKLTYWISEDTLERLNLMKSRLKRIDMQNNNFQMAQIVSKRLRILKNIMAPLLILESGSHRRVFLKNTRTDTLCCGMGTHVVIPKSTFNHLGGLEFTEQDIDFYYRQLTCLSRNSENKIVLYIKAFESSDIQLTDNNITKLKALPVVAEVVILKNQLPVNIRKFDW